MNDLSPSVLRRMAGAGRAEAAIGPMTLPRAAGLALSRAAQDVLRVPLSLSEAAHSDVPLDAVAELLPEGALLVLVHGQGGARGLMALDRSLLSAILQAQTTGRVTGATVAERNPTQTDAVLTRRFLSIFLDSLALRLEGQRYASWARSYSPRDRVADAKRLPHVLADGVYGTLRLTVDIAQGVRQGQLVLCLPSRGAPGVADDMASSEGRVWGEAIASRVLDSQAELDAVLMRIKLPLSQVSRLAVGDVISFGAATLTRLRLEGAGGSQIGSARLGRANGMRAIKVVLADAADKKNAEPAKEEKSKPATGTTLVPVDGKNPPAES